MSVEIGEGFSGSGADAAHINTILGLRDGPVGTAFSTALATPSAGHVPFLCVYQPGVPCEPPTLFVNKAAIANDTHGHLTWGAAQAGAAEAVTTYASERFSPSEQGKWCLIVAVWVDPKASDEEAVYRNNKDATLTALERGAHGPDGEASRRLTAGEPPSNPYFRVR